MTDFLRRLRALIHKEWCQMLRDPSSLLIGIVIPMMMILLIGSAMSFDIKKVPVAVVMEDSSPTVRDMLGFLQGSDYFSPRYVTSMAEAENLMDYRQADIILCVPPDFTSRLRQQNGSLQIISYGVDAATARTMAVYVESGLNSWQAAHQKDYVTTTSASLGSVSIVNRQWFNDANTSTWLFIPGLIVIVMTLVGVFLTALVMAREWERGTLESLFITPVKPLEILLAKMIPYFSIAMLGFTLCMLSARYLYDVPIHGSLFIIILSSMEYVLVALGIGLTISSVVKNQFLACQLSLVVSMLPTIMLSGFMFDLRSVPVAISAVGHILPATYYMELLKSLFLAGNNWTLIGKNCLILAAYALLFILLSLKVTRKKLE